MPRPLILGCFSFLLVGHAMPIAARAADEARPILVDQADWPWWRGPQRDGIASGSDLPPLTWSESENVLWSTAVPGRGHGSPTIVGDQLFLATADHETETQSVLCFDRNSGEILWETTVHRGGLASKSNAKASQASSSIACDGHLLFVNFLSHGSVQTTALTRDGKQVWQSVISDYIVHQGYGASPTLHQNLVIVSADNKGGGALVGLDRQSGKEIWRVTRPKKPNYVSPIVLYAAGREQLFLFGCGLVSSYDPRSGEKVWEIEGATTECVTSTVTNGELIITSGGYPRNHISAVRADGSGEVVWESKDRVYVPSMLIKDGYLYGVLDAGVAMCWQASTGVPQWKQRLGGTFSASPVMLGDRLFATNERGQTFVCRATPEELEVLATNQLGDHVMATPTISRGRIYIRAAKQSSASRQEFLYCVGE